PGGVGRGGAARLSTPAGASIGAKALGAACAELKLSAPKLFGRCGALPSSAQYHIDRFLFEHFPEGTGFPPVELPELPADLPAAQAPAYSIDDMTTTEIDDA